jgi:hypothetical protein
VHFVLTGVLILITIIFDAWQLITPSVVLQRWTLAALLLAITAAVWYASRFSGKSTFYLHILCFCLIAADMIIATYLVYSERGMASRAVMLYAIPIVTAGVLASRRATYAAATLATAIYTLAAVRYFVVNFNEGYKIELYGTIGFYSAMFFVIAALTNILIDRGKSEN